MSLNLPLHACHTCPYQYVQLPSLGLSGSSSSAPSPSFNFSLAPPASTAPPRTSISAVSDSHPFRLELNDAPPLPASPPPVERLTTAPVLPSVAPTLPWNQPRPERTASPASGSYTPTPRKSMLLATATPTRAHLRRRAPGAMSREGKELLKRWEGWETETSTVYVTATDEVPTAITVWETYGQFPVVDGGTITITEYQGDATLTVLGPSYLTLTFYPTTTTYNTIKVIIPTATKTKTKTYAAASTPTICNPGDSAVKERKGLKPTHDQSITLYVIAIYIIGIGVAWNLIGLRDLLFPYKMLVIGFHETGHLLSCICLGYRIGSINLSPEAGGQTLVYLADQPEAPLPFGALPLAYLFNIFIGGLLTFCGFNTLASKIASFILAFCWISIFTLAHVRGKIMTILAAGLMVGLWWADHAWGLRFYILFIGVMSSFYVIWDTIDDAVFAKNNPCCPALYAREMPVLSPGLWTIVWIVISFIFFIGFILAGLATWKESHHAMFCQAQAFLPT